ncbi:DUF1990 family protein [Actinoplanes sp. NPDC051343]|uniref:DUF1990 family protein n=1 Tax=Actinoplanes sp. NPDC051343 TaxID=3363906 RepID=UPI0037B99295
MRRHEPEAVTYREVGATRDPLLPAGYGHVHRDVVIGHGRAAFDAAVGGLFGWDMHRRAGFGVTSSAGRAAVGVTVLLRAGWGRASLAIPCRVVYTVDDQRCRGFAYGTMPGHPERGEEAFLVELTDVDVVRFRVRAFSRPASFLARAGGPVTRLAQHIATNRYVTAMRGLAAGADRGSGRSPV